MTKELDISSEEFRVYTYGDGTKFRVDAPSTLHVIVDDKGSTSHRVIDVDGVTHRPERGWVGISWCARDGEPKFVA